jgi:hypothetical protein
VNVEFDKATKVLLQDIGSVLLSMGPFSTVQVIDRRGDGIKGLYGMENGTILQLRNPRERRTYSAADVQLEVLFEHGERTYLLAEAEWYKRDARMIAERVYEHIPL